METSWRCVVDFWWYCKMAQKLWALGFFVGFGTGDKGLKIINLTHFSLVLHLISKQVIWFAVQIKWLVSIWNATLGWNGLRWMLPSVGSRYSRMDQVKYMEDSLWKIWSDMVCLSRPYHFKFFKACLLQVLLCPFLSTLTQLIYFYMMGTLSFKGSNSENLEPFFR